MRFVRVVMFLAVVALPGCKGDRAKCETAVRNYADLMGWKAANAEIDALPEGERALARKKKLSQMTNELESKIDFVVDQCVSANNEEQVNCMIAAKTADQASKCADLVPKK